VNVVVHTYMCLALRVIPCISYFVNLTVSESVRVFLNPYKHVDIWLT